METDLILTETLTHTQKYIYIYIRLLRQSQHSGLQRNLKLHISAIFLVTEMGILSTRTNKLFISMVAKSEAKFMLVCRGCRSIMAKRYEEAMHFVEGKLSLW